MKSFASWDGLCVVVDRCVVDRVVVDRVVVAVAVVDDDVDRVFCFLCVDCIGAFQ